MGGTAKRARNGVARTVFAGARGIREETAVSVLGPGYFVFVWQRESRTRFSAANCGIFQDPVGHGLPREFGGPNAGRVQTHRRRQRRVSFGAAGPAISCGRRGTFRAVGYQGASRTGAASASIFDGAAAQAHAGTPDALR